MSYYGNEQISPFKLTPHTASTGLCEDFDLSWDPCYKLESKCKEWGVSFADRQ